MGRSLSSQMKHCVAVSFHGDKENGISGGFGVSKHSDKRNGQKNGKIYSYNTYNNRQSTAKGFAEFMKDKHPEVRQVKDLTSQHATEYLQQKSREVSTTTLDNIRSNLKSLGDNINHVFKSCDINLETPRMRGITDEKVKTVSMTETDYRSLLNSYDDRFDTGAVGVQVIYASGLRAHEVVKLRGTDIKIENDRAVVHVQSGKGGRERDVEITDPSRVETLREIADHYQEERVCPIKAHSLQENVARHLDKIETEQNYDYNVCHSIRKEWAQDTYDQYKEMGYEPTDAWGKTCEGLGHSADREALFNTYISKA